MNAESLIAYMRGVLAFFVAVWFFGTPFALYRVPPRGMVKRMQMEWREMLKINFTGKSLRKVLIKVGAIDGLDTDTTLN